MAEGQVDEAKLAALKVEFADLLSSIAAQGDKIMAMKENGEPGAKVEEEAKVLVGLKEKLPFELMGKKDQKKYLKKQAAEAKAKEKAARAAKWAPKEGSKASKKKKSKAPEAVKVEFVNTTPVGEKKDMTVAMEGAYNPPQVESAWDAWWEAQGFYSCDVDEAKNATNDEKFVIVIPPPNVTGSLHIGHALTCSIEDTLCRWNRMCGKHVMWLPGTDHAGIATQAVVEKKIWREDKKTRYDLGREKFLEKVWEWKEKSGSRILTQLRRLGASVDHSRTVFTMDEQRGACVKEAFVQMYEQGIIYRDTRLVNWSHALNTAISDIEVDHADIDGITLRSVKGHDPEKKYEFGTLTSFAYKIADANGNPTDEEIVVATTRLETMLGDSAVAVNPNDDRYKHLHGKSIYHPFRKCTIPIVCDEELVDMSFGSGAVKITPAHDPNDFKCGRKHNLPELSMLNDDGTINGICGAPFEGMMRFDGRYFIEEELKKLGLFREKKGHKMVIPICSRSGDIIEPRLKPQWWVNCQGMAAEAVEKVKSKELKIVPEFHEGTWYHWLEDAHDWCISRQLWWGHRIPAYKVVEPAQSTEKWVVARTEEEAAAKAAKDLGCDVSTVKIEQDPDVLDTWFSSGLFPFSTFGWATGTEQGAKELEAFFPGTLLETGHDILFFWVARMVMMSLQLMKKLPFETVYLHAMVRDKYGRKMSKSLGNVIDPISVIEGITLEDLHKTLYNGNLPEKEIEKAKEGQKLDYPDGIPECGADALRFGLLAYTVQGRDVNLDINRVGAYRRFCNKLWQVTKFMMMNIGESFAPSPTFLQDVVSGQVQGISMRDRWILNRLSHTAAACNKGMENYEFASCTTALNNFYLDNLCDVYVEAVKPTMYAGAKDTATEEQKLALAAAQNTLWYCLDIALRLMHPIMPFVTEELWQRLPGKPATAAASVMISHYPGAEPIARHKGNEQIRAETDAIAALAKDIEAATYLELVGCVAKGMRSVAADFKVSNNKNLCFYIKVPDAPNEQVLATAIADLQVLGKAKQVTILDMNEEPPRGCAASLAEHSIQLFILLEGVIDPAKEIQKVEKELAKTEKELKTFSDRVNSAAFCKFKEHAQKKMVEDVETLTIKVQTLNEQAAMFKALL
uniref:Valine--tRNA ligase, mitochondrial n=1 Tax=Mucochytrium quahogii TaxID=96639 RepID=A0A7S2RR09_9STRA|mmetsp:Transcript_30970/g.49690  ORF Transcript_30970/g.49690 Transcript_30970/m.49690 type:complete len:1134 (+) Transcript_30970:44-3445(+)|eukprot:CAMPEP_0203763098 /NCGR_PEP_ID=MMETSP0098-20131031/15786_1 /ASSEMBLY_ACC=CAM_ASM_000208 /TAXON_ID=96639 /ORGANISM=" , Strain NY0313808BC1" /LENGTH=1133 /DNA_ID=CAMNT_0050657701 /DNA_START=29 /DNA_END=3430 /DNA_ORIENTATION=-